MAAFRIVPNPTNPTQNIVVDPLGNLAVIRADNGTPITIIPSNDVVDKLNTEYGKNLTATNNVQASLEQAINVLKMSGGNTGTANNASGGSSSNSSGGRQTVGQNTGASALLGGVENNADFSVDDYNALTTRMRLLTEAANLYAKLYGYLVTPRVDPVTGNIIGYDPVLDNDKKQILTQEAIKQQFDVDKLITDNEIARAGISGKIRDPNDPTKYIDTPAALLQIAQKNLTEANAGKVAVDSELARAGISGKMQDPSDPTGRTWIDTPAAKLQAAQTDAAKASSEQVRNDIRVKNQELLSAALADPNRFVESYTKANLYGTRLGGTTPPPPPAAAPVAAPAGSSGVPLDTSAVDNALNTDSNAVRTHDIRGPRGVPDAMNSPAPQVSAGMEVNQENIDALGSTTQLPISANLDAALGGKYVGNAASVSNNGTAGMKTLSNISPASGNYAKISPVVYNNLDPTSQEQYNSLALAKQGIGKDALKKTIAGQLGGSSGGVPAAFRLR